MYTSIYSYFINLFKLYNTYIYTILVYYNYLSINIIKKKSSNQKFKYLPINCRIANGNAYYIYI